MAYNNPYGHPYAVPGYMPFPGAPGMPPLPGLGPPPGMSPAPGMAPPPGVQQSNLASQANRPSGLPPSFHPPANLPNINFNAPVIRLGTSAPPLKTGAPAVGDRKDSYTPTGNSRHGLGMDRGLEHSRAQMRENMQSTARPTEDDKKRTIFVHKIPAGVGGDEGIQRLLSTIGRLRRWDSALSHMTDFKGLLFGFAQFEDFESVVFAEQLLRDVMVPSKKQSPSENPPQDEDDSFEGIDKEKLQVAFDDETPNHINEWKEAGRGDDPAFAARLAEAKSALKQFIRDLFYPRVRTGKDAEGDTAMADAANALGENVEVINIPLAQEDELADIPAEMRETVAAEIAAFRDRSNRRDMERLRREEEFEEQERLRNGAPRTSGFASPPSANSNMVPLGPRGIPNAPSGPRGQGRGVEFVNGGAINGHASRILEEDDSDADDEELFRREQAKMEAEMDKLYMEAERKWVNRERQRGNALEREMDREKRDKTLAEQEKVEQMARDKEWKDDQEAQRKNHMYYRDHAAWARNRAAFRAQEAAHDEDDRRAEAEERRKAEADMEQARGMADSFLERQAQEMERKPEIPAAAPQRVTISFGAAAQRAAQRAAPTRRTVAEVEGLLDDEEQDQTTKRRLIPIKFEPITDTKAMSEEDLQQAVRALASEIPVDREGLWSWDVKWDYLEDSVIHEKLRPFVEKKVVEYLGVQEQFLIDIVEEHLRKHKKPAELVETLSEALDEDAEDLVKKLWRMVIFFTESEKRGLPA